MLNQSEVNNTIPKTRNILKAERYFQSFDDHFCGFKQTDFQANLRFQNLESELKLKLKQGIRIGFKKIEFFMLIQMALFERSASMKQWKLFDQIIDLYKFYSKQCKKEKESLNFFIGLERKIATHS